MHVRSSLLLAVILFAVVGAATSAQESIQGQTTVIVSGAALAVQDDESDRIQQMFSHQPVYSRPAPRTWSSRLEIRWSARWQSAPRYAV